MKLEAGRKSAIVSGELLLSPTDIMFKGILLKKNKFFQKQPRLFILQKDGVLKYYKDFTKYKGNIILSKTTKVFKTARN